MGVPIVSGVAKKVFGTRNERLVKRYLRIVDEVSSFGPAMIKLTDPELRAKTQEFKDRVSDGADVNAMIPEIFAVAREGMDRSVGIRNIFDPSGEFDPSVLDDSSRSLYDQVKATIDATEPETKSRDFLGCTEPVPSWKFVDIPPALYEAVRKLHPVSKPPFRARPFDVQIIGGIVLSEGQIAEMKTGEGKTIVAPLACYLSVIEGNQVHVVTVNDYLVKRDRDWTFPFFHAMGLTAGAIHPQHMQPPQLKKAIYFCDVVYGTTAEFGFDYLRDNMKLSVAEQVQRKRQVAIVDEVDSSLIDEARTPLIISGPAHEHAPRYEMADRLAKHLMQKQVKWDAADTKVQSCLVSISGLEGDIRNSRDKDKIPHLKSDLDSRKAELPQLEEARDQFRQFYEVELDKKRATLTHEGIAEAQKEAGLGSFYVGENIDLPHLMEQSIRAHTVYQRDRDYIVTPADNGDMSVVIVDQNTGRKMVGRQWSDGLHQAVEAKESVPIKQETQTMATITIQNFFKLYDKLAGMTGTADTEATEFYEIYGLDVLVIPTNVPVIRYDRDDRVYLTSPDKNNAILEEIKTFHDVGRPILVGTTSVEKSKELSDELKSRWKIEHEVLNAEQHDRESEIIKGAGQLGAVMIATNMAGRGTDIKLQPITLDDLINHWKRRGICPRDVTSEMSMEEIRNRVYRHVAPAELECRKADVESMSDEDVHRKLLESWYTKHCWGKSNKVNKLSEADLMEALDESGGCVMHRIEQFKTTESLGGLHVIATERHDSRRIDNQLRGRSGRQGDRGSTRFFLSLEDDLMKMFAGPTTLKILSKLGMKEGDAIEHPMLSKAVGKAQRKVEERNFLIRKNILEYDEVMDLQRHSFYGMRQDVLEGRGIKELIFEHLENSINDAAYRFLDERYPSLCMCEWIREHLGVEIDADRLKGKDRSDLHRLVQREAREEAGTIIDITLPEFLSHDIDLGKGKMVERDEHGDDYQGLVDWANSHFKAGLKVSDIRDMNKAQISRVMNIAAEELVESTDLSPLDPFLLPEHAKEEMAKWISSKFGVEWDASIFDGVDEPEPAASVILERAHELYAERERVYPVDFAMDMTTAMLQQDPAKALEQFCRWARLRYELEWTPETLPSANPVEIRDALLLEVDKWDDDRRDQRARNMVSEVNDVEELDQWCREHIGSALTDDERTLGEENLASAARAKVDALLRLEMLQFERWVLLQIVDGAWKDHLHSMDQLRESIGYRSFSQRDPRIEFKREGANLFEEMYSEIRDKVTDLIFKARLQPQVKQPEQGQAQQPPQPPQQPQQPQAQPRERTEAESAVAAAAAAVSAVGTKRQQSDIAAAQSAGSRPMRKQPAAAPVTVGRNEPCPCGSGKKYKKCCGAA